MTTWGQRCAVIGNCCMFSAWMFANIFLNVLCCIGITTCGLSPKRGFWRLCHRQRKPADDQQYAVLDSAAIIKASTRATEDENAIMGLENNANRAAEIGNAVGADSATAYIVSSTPFRDTAMSNPMKITHRTVSWEPFAVTVPGKAPIMWDETVGLSSSRVKQGNLGDCWLLASIAGAADRKGLLERVFVTPQSRGTPEKPFAFGSHVVMLHTPDGQPKSLPLDTFFPTISGAKLVFGKSEDPQEMWVSMLEKAFAKLRGGYEKLEEGGGGVPSTALHALTGAATERVEHSDLPHPTDLWKELASADADLEVSVAATPSDYSSLAGFAVLCALCSRCCSPLDTLACIACPRRARRCVGLCCRRHCWGCFGCFSYLWGSIKAFFGAILAILFCPCIACGACRKLAPYATRGLVPGHAYSILSVHEVPCCCGCDRRRLVKLRNPWGKGEWVGPWSDTSCLWCCIPTKEKDRIGYDSKNDGVFFMTVDDFYAEFASTSICHARPGWANIVTPSIVRGPCAYWTITVSPLAPPTAALPNGMPHFGGGGGGGGGDSSGGGGGGGSGGAGAMLASNPFANAGGAAATTTAASTSTHIGNVSGAAKEWENQLQGGQEEEEAQHHQVVVVGNPLQQQQLQQQFNSFGSSGGSAFSAVPHGVRCFVSLLHPDGATMNGALEGNQGVRVCVLSDETRKPLASSRPVSAMSSYTPAAAVGTGAMVLEAGKTYTVFAQWSKRDSLMMSPNGRNVSLLVSVSDGASITVNVPPAGPLPRPAWAPSSSLFGHCNRTECRMPLPSEFDFIEGKRYHPECRPDKK